MSCVIPTNKSPSAPFAAVLAVLMRVDCCRLLRRCVSVLAFAFLFTPAQAQLFTDDAARQQAGANADRIEDITSALRTLNEDFRESSERDKNIRQQMGELSQKIQGWDQQFRELRGRIDELEQQQSDGNNDLRRDVESAADGLASVSDDLAALKGELEELISYYQPPPENNMYLAAYTALQQREYQDAISGFERVLRFYPGGQFSANAQYWISQAHLALEDFTAAKDSAAKLMADYPDSDKVPAALLIIGRALIGEGDAEAARQQLLLLLDKYPTSLAADEARQLVAQ